MALPRGPGPHPASVLSAVRRPQDGAYFKAPPYPGYPFLMIPDLSSPYLSNGPLSPGGARTVSESRRAGVGARPGPPWLCVGGGGGCRADPGPNLFAGWSCASAPSVGLRWPGSGRKQSSLNFPFYCG